MYAMESIMLMWTKTASILTAAMLGVALSAPWADLAVARPAQSNAATQTDAPLQSGDLVRLRSGGPLMTVESVQGDHVICSWSTGYGDLRSGSFPVAMITTPVTPPPPNDALQKDERAVDQYYQRHCPSGTLSFSGKFHCAY